MSQNWCLNRPASEARCRRNEVLRQDAVIRDSNEDILQMTSIYKTLSFLFARRELRKESNAHLETDVFDEKRATNARSVEKKRQQAVSVKTKLLQQILTSAQQCRRQVESHCSEVCCFNSH